MTEDTPRDLPAQIADAIASVPKALVPNCVKALDRLMGAAVDIPVAWLEQQKAKLESRTKSYQSVENAIGGAAANRAASDQETIKNAVGFLVSKAYRKQKNVEAVARAAMETIVTDETSADHSDTASLETDVLDDDWLNVFERYAEDATSDRMQNLWGRVLAGEIRKPGRYSLRTLRFLSEFSQNEALAFQDLCQNSFDYFVPTKLGKPTYITDIKHLLNLESSGLVNGVISSLSYTITCNEEGKAIIREGDLVIFFKSKPDTKISTEALTLTPLGQELIGLLPSRDLLSSARAVALAMRRPEIEECELIRVVDENRGETIEVLWQSTPTEKTES